MGSRYHQKLQTLQLRARRILLLLLVGRLSWKSGDLERVGLMEVGMKVDPEQASHLCWILGSSRKREKEGLFALEGAEASSQ